KGIDFQIKREGVAEPFWVNVRPDLSSRRMRPTIGVVQPLPIRLSDPQPVVAGTPAAKVDAFRPGDLLVSINGQPIREYADVEAQLAANPDKPVKFTVQRGQAESSADEAKATEQLDIEVPARPTRTLGLSMKMGKI